MVTFSLPSLTKTLNAIKKRVNKVVKGKSVRNGPVVSLKSIDNEVRETLRWLHNTLSDRNFFTTAHRQSNGDESDTQQLYSTETQSIIFLNLLHRTLETNRVHCAQVKKHEKESLNNATYRPPSQRVQQQNLNYRNKSMDHYLTFLQTVRETGTSLMCLVTHLQMNCKYFGRHVRGRGKSNRELNQLFTEAFDDLIFDVVSTLQTLNECFNQLNLTVEQIIEKHSFNNNVPATSSPENDSWKLVNFSLVKSLKKALWAKQLIDKCRESQDALEIRFEHFLHMAHDKALRLRQWLALMIAFALIYLLLIQRLLDLTWALLICGVYAGGANFVVELSISYSKLGKLNKDYQSDRWKTDHVKHQP